jgi:tetratricopeptide (TPR) repeat protein
LEASVRLKQNAEDNCVACHMVQSPTDIPHFVFTHHRIGFHDAAEQTDTRNSIGNLVPIADVAHLPQVIQDRALGVAYLEYMRTQRSPAAQQTYYQRAKTLLNSAYQTGLRDAELEALLARLAWEEKDFDRATRLATAALEKPSFLSPAHAIALDILGDSYMTLNDFPAADRALGQLVDYRRYSTDWIRLAEARQRNGNREGAIAALEQAARIAPFQIYVHQLLADGYQSVGKTEASQRHRRLAQELEAVR